MRESIERNWLQEVAFLKSLVRVASDNPPGDCALHAEAAAVALEGLGFTVERHP
ncbi:MAG: peptidase M20, partial [Bauldia sp.]